MADRTDSSPSPATHWPHAVRSLERREYRLFLAGQLISLVGTWIDTVAESWLIYRLTGSATLLGITGFAGQFPVFLLSLLGGAMADRFDRRLILVATQTASMLLALALAVLTLTGLVQVWHVIVLAALLGIVNAIDIPTRQAFVFDLVGRAHIVNAVALNSTMFNAARVVGPAVAGLLVAAVGEGWCFLINGVSFIAVIGGLLLIRSAQQKESQESGSRLHRLTAGLRYAGQHRPILALLLLVGLMSVMGTPYSVLMPIFSNNILHAGAAGLGILMAMAGCGALLGAVSLAVREGIRGLGRWITVGSAVFGLALILFSLSQSFWLSAIILLAVGASMIVVLAACNTLLQSMVPDELRGRVMALYSMVFMGSAPLGALAAGFIADRWSAPVVVALGGSCCIVGAAIFGFSLPALRKDARQLLLSLEAAGGMPAQQITSQAVSDD